LPDIDLSPKRPVTAQTVGDAGGSGDWVYVGCKIPNGVILQRFEWKEEVVSTPTGLQSMKLARPVPGSQFHLNSIGDLRHKPKDFVDRFGGQIAPGFCSITRVPRDLWESWSEIMRDSDLLKNGMVFACKSHDDAVLEATSRADIRSGLEPIDPDRPELTTGREIRAVRNQMGGVSQVMRGDPSSNA
jgi:hypothetical protein